jgi:aminomethyltransferase
MALNLNHMKICLRSLSFKINSRAFHPGSSVCLASQEGGAKPAPQKTVLYDFHVANGGKIVDFAGWLMPVQYKNVSIQESHLHTRANCSLFDVSHMMQVKVHGKDRYKFIENLVVTDIANLKPNTGSLTVFTNEKGGIIDDLIVSNTSLGYLYIVSNAGCAQKDFAHMKSEEERMRAQKMDVKLERIEDKGLLALQGPKMKELLQEGVKFDLKRLPFMGTIESSVFGIDGCRITRCGYTGEDGVEISVPKEKTADLAYKLIEFKNGQVCKLAGLGARDTLRLEAGLCLYGNDIDETKTPVEAGLNWLISKRRKEEKNFPGAAAILKQLKEKPLIKRVGLKMVAKKVPTARQHAQIYDISKANELVGEITSGCLSPSLGENISMGYINLALSKVDTKVNVDVRGKKYEAIVVKLPFLPTNYYHI